MECTSASTHMRGAEAMTAVGGWRWLWHGSESGARDDCIEYRGIYYVQHVQKSHTGKSAVVSNQWQIVMALARFQPM
jgi:hypothetical protein